MNQQSHAKTKMGPLGLASLGAFPSAGGMPPGVDPPQVNPNAAAAQFSCNLYFADGDNMTMNPPAVGTENGDPAELCAEIDRLCGEIKDMVRLKYQHRAIDQPEKDAE